MLTEREKKCSMFRSSLFQRRDARAFPRHPVLLAALCGAGQGGRGQSCSALELRPMCYDKFGQFHEPSIRVFELKTPCRTLLLPTLFRIPEIG